MSQLHCNKIRAGGVA